MVIMLAGLQAIPPELYEAGADRWCGGLEILSAHHLATVKAHPHVLCDHVHHRLTEDFYRTLYFNLRGGPAILLRLW